MAQSDEIDLLDLAIKLNRVFITNLKRLITAFVIGTIAGLAFYLIVPKVYESKMIFSSDVLTFSTSNALVDDLQKLVREDNNVELANILQITSDEADKIVGIKLESSIEKPEGLKEQEKTLLSIIIKSKDRLLFGRLQPSLIKFFETNPYALLREREKKSLYQGVIDKISKEISELEKMRNQFSEGTLFKSSNVIALIAIKGFRQMVRLANKKEE